MQEVRVVSVKMTFGEVMALTFKFLAATAIYTLGGAFIVGVIAGLMMGTPQ